MIDASATASVHAAALVIGEAGVLIEGASGSGKSALTLAAIAAGQAQGLFAALVSDDRVRLAVAGGRLIASAHPAIAGQIERRGLQIEPSPFCSQAVLRLVVRMVSGAQAADLPRLPWLEPSLTQNLGVSLPLLPLDTARGRSDQVALLLSAVKTAALQNEA